MCKACNQRDALTEKLSTIKTWAGYDVARHLVVAYTCKSGGIQASTIDEFTARRIAKVYRDLGWIGVDVVPNTDKALAAVHQRLNALFER